MISFLECKDFKEEYIDEFNSARKTRNKSCQHFEINMKLYSNKGKFLKYTIRFTCKFCKNDCLNEFNENNKSFKYECIKCKNSILFRYINTLEDTVNLETIKKPNEEDNNKKFDFNEINKHDVELIHSQVNAKFPQKESNIKDNNEAKLKIYETQKIYKTPNNSDAKLKIYQTPNISDYIPAPACQNNNSDVNKKVKIKFVFNDSKDHIELNPSISMEKQFDIIQKKFNFQDQKKIYLNGDEIDYKMPLSEIKCIDKLTFEIDN